MCDCSGSNLLSSGFHFHSPVEAKGANDVINAKLSALGPMQHSSASDYYLSKFMRSKNYFDALRMINKALRPNLMGIGKYVPSSNISLAYDLTFQNKNSVEFPQHLIVILNKNTFQYFSILTEVLGRNLKVSWSVGGGYESLLLPLVNSRPPGAAPCPQQGLSFKDCFKCAWDDLGSDMAGTIAEAAFWYFCAVACAIACGLAFPVPYQQGGRRLSLSPSLSNKYSVVVKGRF
ncbi:MAG: hypothetical protein JWO06_3370 [Bacteroidota bacterium]|nr:hypothetical protein [Bacteroidota bacterium]